MGYQKINGKSFSTSIGDLDIYVSKFSLEISDESAVATSHGRPNGYLLGNVSASGEIEVDASEFAKLSAAAKEAGSWQALDVFDIHSYAKVGDIERKVEAFGCRLKLSKILDVDDSSADATTHTIPYDVVSEDFVSIDGVPYVTPLES
jgi:hypothetical protein